MKLPILTKIKKVFGKNIKDDGVGLIDFGDNVHMDAKIKLNLAKGEIKSCEVSVTKKF